MCPTTYRDFVSSDVSRVMPTHSVFRGRDYAPGRLTLSLFNRVNTFAAEFRPAIGEIVRGAAGPSNGRHCHVCWIDRNGAGSLPCPLNNPPGRSDPGRTVSTPHMIGGLWHSGIYSFRWAATRRVGRSAWPGGPVRLVGSPHPTAVFGSRTRTSTRPPMNVRDTWEAGSGVRDPTTHEYEGYFASLGNGSYFSYSPSWSM